MKLLSVLAAAALSLISVSASAIPLHSLRRGGDDPVFDSDFADPSIIQDEDGMWYGFGTAGNDKQVQVSTGESMYGTWNLLKDIDALPRSASWTTGRHTWAPDVRRARNGKYVMYYSGEVAEDSAHHCIGAAVADVITGPYVPEDEPFACNLTAGGSIDASGFQDADGKQYVLYKVDGNSVGHGGSCSNTNSPIVPTPIMLQEVEEDGVTKVGEPIEIFNRSDEDGPLVEAPSMLRTDNGLYILFFSSGCYLEPSYNVNYATSTSLTGPFQRAQRPVIKSGEYTLHAPGGATAVHVGDKVGIAFHADCQQGRCMHTSHTVVDGREVRVVM
ncbi:glycoside hydrolase family 43 protein [Daldinia bambusicola]|nr:glycoside hydrolase family 43 protein [Daldinia bambusicola]